MDRGTDVVAVGPFPPPVHGAALITDRVVDSIDPHLVVHRADFSPTARERCGLSLAGRLWRSVWAVRHVLSRSCQLLYLSVPGGYGVLLVLPVAVVARLRGCRIVCHHNSFAYLSRRRRLHALLFRVTRSGTHITGCVSMSALMRKRYVPTATMVEVSNSIFVRPPTDAASSRFGHRQSRLVLGHLSNLSVAKGLDVVVDAAVNLVESGADVALRLAGPLDSEVEERIVQRAASKLGARLSYWGRISQEQLDEFFAGVDLFVFPSRYVNEALPLVVLEAVSRGIPCVASDVGCLGEMLGTVAIPDPGPSDVVSFVRRGERRVVDRDALAHDRDTAVDALASVLPIDRSRLPGTHG